MSHVIIKNNTHMTKRPQAVPSHTCYVISTFAHVTLT